MRPFGQTSGTLRAFAAFVSLALTVAIFLLLRATSAPAPARKAELQVSVTVFPLRPVPAKTAPAPATLGTARIAPRSPASIRATPQSLQALPQAEPAVASALPSTGAPAEATPASAPLRLDPQALARAIAGTEGSVRKMARQGGAELDSPRATRSELLAATVAEKGVPDCLAPNGGGSLLSAPILLLRALNGSCK